MMSRTFLLFIAFSVSACDPNSRGFVLPDGNIDSGKAAFNALACTQCHSVGDVEWQGGEGDPQIALGGPVGTLKTYGDLVTSIINPSHRIARPELGAQVAIDGESQMRRYNEVMTVEQLVDIVSFLQTEYDLALPARPYVYGAW